MKSLLLVALLSSLSVSAAQVCTNVYNPMERRWEYQCVDGHTPQCHQQYDVMNRRWVTVCN